MELRHPIYAEADIVVDCADDYPDVTTGKVADALAAWRPPHRLTVRSSTSASYDIVVGDGLLHRGRRPARPRPAAETRRRDQ